MTEGFAHTLPNRVLSLTAQLAAGAGLFLFLVFAGPEGLARAQSGSSKKPAWQDIPFDQLGFRGLSTPASREKNVAALMRQGLSNKVAGEYVSAEIAMGGLLRFFKAPRDQVRIAYHDLEGSYGAQRNQHILINPKAYPNSLESVFHEPWHMVQQCLRGKDFAREYGEESARKGVGNTYVSNPFETEARYVGRLLFTKWKHNGMRPRKLRAMLTELARNWTLFNYSWTKFRTKRPAGHQDLIRRRLTCNGMDPGKLDTMTRNATRKTAVPRMRQRRHR